MLREPQAHARVRIAQKAHCSTWSIFATRCLPWCRAAPHVERRAGTRGFHCEVQVTIVASKTSGSAGMTTMTTTTSMRMSRSRHCRCWTLYRSGYRQSHCGTQHRRSRLCSNVATWHPRRICCSCPRVPWPAPTHRWLRPRVRAPLGPPRQCAAEPPSSPWYWRRAWPTLRPQPHRIHWNLDHPL